MNAGSRRLLAAAAALALVACTLVLLYRVCQGLIRLPWPI